MPPPSDPDAPPLDHVRKVYVEPTTACDLNCGMCIRHGWEDPGGEMTQETFGRLIADLRGIATVETLQFGGFGEPTMHPRRFEFLLLAKEAGLRVEMLTNGVSLDAETAAALLDLELDKLVVSMDGVGPTGDAAFHGDAISGVQANLRGLNRMKLARQAAKPEVGLEFVATRRNVDVLPGLKRLCPELGVSSILVTNLVPYAAALAEETLYRHWSTTRRDPEPSPWNPTIDLPRMDADGPGEVVDRLRGSGTHVRLDGTAVSGGAMRCPFVHDGALAVTSDGNVSPCLPLMHTHAYYFRGQRRRIRAYHAGNVNEMPLGAIWSSETYRRFRDRASRFTFSPCLDCGGCDLRATNEDDCYANGFPACGECLWAAGIIRCP
jgi:MoaA/NifB/PqqE/SkfB family radical SAM enzyme